VSEPTHSPKYLRARRAAERWIELGGDAVDCPVRELAQAIIEATHRSGRPELSEDEIALVIVTRISEWVLDEAAKAKVEAERRAYLAKRAIEYRAKNGWTAARPILTNTPNGEK
jgi:hypothetical protein